MLPKWGVEWQTKDFVRDEASAPAAHIRKAPYMRGDTRWVKTPRVNAVIKLLPKCVCVWGVFDGITIISAPTFKEVFLCKHANPQ